MEIRLLRAGQTGVAPEVTYELSAIEEDRLRGRIYLRPFRRLDVRKAVRKESSKRAIGSNPATVLVDNAPHRRRRLFEFLHFAHLLRGTSVRENASDNTSQVRLRTLPQI